MGLDKRGRCRWSTMWEMCLGLLALGSANRPLRQDERVHAMLVSLLSPTEAWITSLAIAVSCSDRVSATSTT